MIVLGAHYLPFIFSYGMWQFGLLAGALVGSGFVLGAYLPRHFSLGAWLTGGFLLTFAFVARSVVIGEISAERKAAGEAAKALIALGGSQPDLEDVSRRRPPFGADEVDSAM